MATRIRASQIVEDTLEDKDGDTKVTVEESSDEDKIRFDTAGSQRMIIDETGQVGVGTDAPEEQFHIHGTNATLRLGNGVNSGEHSPKIQFSELADANGDMAYGYSVGYNGTSNNFEIKRHSNNVSGNEVLIANRNTGDIGIKTASPEADLHIYGGNSGQTFSNVTFAVENDGSSDSFYAFQAATAGGGKSFSITNGGKVGIGTSSPISKLDVAGKIAITSEVATPSAPADGKGWLYTKSDGKLYWQSNDVSETDLTSGGGGGGSDTFVLTDRGKQTSSPSTSYIYHRTALNGADWTSIDSVTSYPTFQYGLYSYHKDYVVWQVPVSCTLDSYQVKGLRKGGSGAYTNNTVTMSIYKMSAASYGDAWSTHSDSDPGVTKIVDIELTATNDMPFDLSGTVSSGNTVAAGESLYYTIKATSAYSNSDHYWTISLKMTPT